MSIRGTLNCDVLAVGLLSADWFKQPERIRATAALVNSKTSSTHGFVSSEGVKWSDETLKLLRALRESMEKDFARVHLVGVQDDAAGQQSGLQIGSPPAGLSEHLGSSESDARQV